MAGRDLLRSGSSPRARLIHHNCTSVQRQQLVEFQEVGYGSAASTLLFFIVAVLTVLYVSLGRVRLEAD